MKIILYGPTGRAGSRILQELLRRRHQVIAVARTSGAIPEQDGVTTAVDDLSDIHRVAEVIKGSNAVISAYAPPPDNTDQLVAVTRLLVEAVAQSGVPRLLMVGGAGSLQVAPGLTLIDSGSLPPAWLSIAKSHSEALDVLKSSLIDWTSLSPAAYFDPGERTGRFRIGTDNLIADEEGNSRISMEDFAIAMVDELENPQHRKQRFSVGY